MDDLIEVNERDRTFAMKALQLIMKYGLNVQKILIQFRCEYSEEFREELKIDNQIDFDNLISILNYHSKLMFLSANVLKKNNMEEYAKKMLPSVVYNECFL